LIVLDTETTGLDPIKDELVAVGWSDVYQYKPKILVRRLGEPIDLFISRVVFHLQKEKTRTMVGYHIDFDKEFLASHSDFFLNWKTIDLVPYVESMFGYRYRLRTIVKKIFNYDEDDEDGEKMPDLWEEGKIDEIRKHLAADVKRTWLLANFFMPIINPSTVATTNHNV